jgi:hypothetical protein
MQPEPTEHPQESLNSPNPSNLVNSSQYGLSTNQLPAAELRGSPLEGYAAPGGLFAAGSPSEVAPLHDQLSGLSLDDKSRARPKPSFQRISEYENALSPLPPRKLNQGPGFTVVKKSGNNLHGPQLENFPNGNNPVLLHNKLF